MPESLTKTINGLMEKWKALDKSQKLRLLLSVIVIIGSAAVAIMFISNPSYVTVVTGTVSEVGEMSKTLTEASIGHKITDNNTAIMVSKKDKDTAEIALAQSGLLKDGIKFSDSLKLITFSTTESDKKKIYKEYYERNLEEKLVKMDTIKSAVVSFTIPEKSVFIGDSEDDDPTASVMITPTGSLSANQIDGIVRVVVSSVERLAAKNVTIVDNMGNILTDSEDTNIGAGFSTKQLEIQAQKKKEVEKQVIALLSDTTDSVKVVANIVCDFNQETQESVKYATPIEDSDSGLVRETTMLSEKLQNMNQGSVPGTDSNQGTGAEVVSAGNGGSYQKTDTSTSYELNQTNTKVTKGLGNVDPNKSSITVNLLYGTLFTEAPSQENVDSITKMVSTATGIDPDRITVASFKITPKAETEDIKMPIDWAGLLENYAPYLAAIIIILILVIFISRLKGGVAMAGAGDYPYSGAHSQDKGAIFEAVAAEDTEMEEIKPMEENSEVKKQINKFIDKQPDIAAGMLRNWIYENEKTGPGGGSGPTPG